MFANRYTAVIDACSLVSVWRRNLLLTLAEAEFFRVRWSDTILQETQFALQKIHEERGSDGPEGRAERAIASMRRAFPEASVEDYEGLICACERMPDANDRHVVAAAIRTQAQAVVTENLRDFPEAVLIGFGLEARCADGFIADTIALDEGRAIAAIRKMRERLRKPELGPEDLIRSLEANSLVETASILSEHVASI